MTAAQRDAARPAMPPQRSAAASPERWPALAAALFAIDPTGLGGVLLRGAAGAARDDWLAQLKALLPPASPWRRMPAHIDDDRLLGGLDLPATLRAGRPVVQRGLLAETDGGVLLIAMAERLPAGTAAHIASVIDERLCKTERHGIGASHPCRLGVVALDEGQGDDERVPERLRERLAFCTEPLPAEGARIHADASGRLRHRETALATAADAIDAETIASARARLPDVRIDDATVEALCATAMALGIASVRAPMLACRAACAAAALAGRFAVGPEDAALAASLVLAWRATQVPAVADDATSDPADAEAPPQAADGPPPAPTTEPEPALNKDADNDTDNDDDTAAGDPAAMAERVLAAAKAAIPPGLLAALVAGLVRPTSGAAAGRSGSVQTGVTRGRPAGVRRGEPRAGARLHLIATLRAAAPWQPLRRREAAASGASPRVHIRREDFHIQRLQQRSETTTVFVVDASGSSALHRLAEAKGAVELLLADCYVRRDQVAVIAFRGAAAELLLPPTRSLVRAKRSLAGLPGGGGTPLAAGIDAAAALADGVRRRGATPVLVLLTDGRANIGRDGAPGRAAAMADALASAQRLRAMQLSVLLLDTSPQPQEPARALAAAMGGRYLPLPHAGATEMSRVVQAMAAASA